MAQAIVDPIELRRFAHSLKLFVGETQNNLSALHGQMLGLGDTWRDQGHLKFVQNFEETLHVLERFMSGADDHIRTLMHKAEMIEDYLQQR